MADRSKSYLKNRLAVHRVSPELELGPSALGVRRPPASPTGAAPGPTGAPPPEPALPQCMAETRRQAEDDLPADSVSSVHEDVGCPGADELFTTVDPATPSCKLDLRRERGTPPKKKKKSGYHSKPLKDKTRRGGHSNALVRWHDGRDH